MWHRTRRKFLGIIMLLVAVTGLGISVAGVIVGRQLIDNIGAGLDQTLALSVESLDNIEDTLLLTKQTIRQVNDGVETVEGTALNLSRTLNETRPLLGQLSQVASEDLPASLEAIQSAIPTVSDAAAAIDDTLVTLNNFRIDQSIFGIPIQYDLGINYAPDVPFDQTIDEVGGSLDGVPQRLRTLKIYLNVASTNLGTASGDMRSISRNLKTINTSVAAVEPLIDEYIRIVIETNVLIEETRIGIRRDLATAKLFVTITMIWIGLAQAAPFYLGWGLLQGRELFDEIAADVQLMVKDG